MKCRFAPSPTGYLHIGNVRTALVNYLYARKAGGEFMLRLDDTDVARSTEEFAQGIREDLQWLGVTWEQEEKQSARLARYEEVKQQLIEAGRLYPCYESQQELETKRKMLLSRGQPPIYDRAALALTEEQRAAFDAEGKKPHWRFKLDENAKMEWDDLVRGPQSFEGRHQSDPILIREDGSMTYMLPSVIDDMDFGITHVLRGEDHISNTAVQIQIFNALGGAIPTFGHTSLIKTKDGGMSKRDGGFAIRDLREKGVDAEAIISLLSRLGTSEPVELRDDIQQAVDAFDIGQFGKAPANYDEEELLRLNHKRLAELPFATAKPQLEKHGLTNVDEAFWLAVRPNISVYSEAKDWWALCAEAITPEIEDADYLASAAELLPAEPWGHDTWKVWTGEVKEATGRKGKQLFMPLRKAITGLNHGPELQDLLPLIGRERVLKRLKGEAA